MTDLDLIDKDLSKLFSQSGDEVSVCRPGRHHNVAHHKQVFLVLVQAEPLLEVLGALSVIMKYESGGRQKERNLSRIIFGGVYTNPPNHTLIEVVGFLDFCVQCTIFVAPISTKGIDL